MPPVSESQRRLMYAAAAKQGGAGGVPQSVGKEFAASDEPGKLPETKKPNRRSEKMYSGKKVMRNG